MLNIIDSEVSLKNIGCFDPFRYCSFDRLLEDLKAVLVPKTNICPFVYVLLRWARLLLGLCAFV